jgi:hypothetical protein
MNLREHWKGGGGPMRSEQSASKEIDWATVVALVSAYAGECCGCSADLAIPASLRAKVDEAAARLPDFRDKHEVEEYADGLDRERT